MVDQAEVKKEKLPSKLDNVLPELTDYWENEVIRYVKAAEIQGIAFRAALYKSLNEVYAFVVKVIDRGVEQDYYERLKHTVNGKERNRVWSAVHKKNPFRPYLDLAIEEGFVGGGRKPGDSSRSMYATVMNYAFDVHKVSPVDFTQWLNQEGISGWYKYAKGTEEYAFKKAGANFVDPAAAAVKEKITKDDRFNYEQEVYWEADHLLKNKKLATTQIDLNKISNDEVVENLASKPLLGTALIRIDKNGNIDIIDVLGAGADIYQSLEKVVPTKKIKRKELLLKPLGQLLWAMEYVDRVSSGKKIAEVLNITEKEFVVETFGETNDFVAGKVSLPRPEIFAGIAGKWVVTKFDIDVLKKSLMEGAEYTATRNKTDPTKLDLTVKNPTVVTGGTIVTLDPLPATDAKGNAIVWLNKIIQKNTQIGKGETTPEKASVFREKYREQEELKIKNAPKVFELFFAGNELVTKIATGTTTADNIAIGSATSSKLPTKDLFIKNEDLLPLFAFAEKEEVAFKVEATEKAGATNGLVFTQTSPSYVEATEENHLEKGMTYEVYIPLRSNKDGQLKDQ